MAGRFPKIPTPTWQGYSIGRWEGDDFVVETNRPQRQNLDGHQRPSLTEAAHITERFRRNDYGHMDIQITIDDPKAYTKPWTITENPSLLVDTDLLESVCEENNKDAQPHRGQVKRAYFSLIFRSARIVPVASWNCAMASLKSACERRSWLRAVIMVA